MPVSRECRAWFARLEPSLKTETVRPDNTTAYNFYVMNGKNSL